MSFAKSAAAGVVAGLVAAGAFELFGRAATPPRPDDAKQPEGVAAALGDSMPFVAGAALGLGYGVLTTLAPQLRTGFGAGYGLVTNALGGAAPAPARGGSLVSDLLVGVAVQGVKQVIADATKPADKGEAGAKA